MLSEQGTDLWVNQNDRKRLNLLLCFLSQTMISLWFFPSPCPIQLGFLVTRRILSKGSVSGSRPSMQSDGSWLLSQIYSSLAAVYHTCRPLW